MQSTFSRSPSPFRTRRPQHERTIETPESVASRRPARAVIAGSLLESLNDAPADEGVEAAWSEEIKRRIEEIDSGKVQMIPYEEVRRRLAARLSDAAR